VIKVAMADDHDMFRSSLALALRMEDDIEVMFEAVDGNDFISQIQATGEEPDIALLDVRMPEKDGAETAEWLKANKPHIRIIALSMEEQDRQVIRMVRAGACGYILKGQKTPILLQAIRQAYLTGITSSEAMTKALINSARFTESLALTPKQKTFCEFSATELTYKEIADKMNVSHRTVDGYREDVFARFNVKSRVSLVITCIKLGIVKVD